MILPERTYRAGSRNAHPTRRSYFRRRTRWSAGSPRMPAVASGGEDESRADDQWTPSLSRWRSTDPTVAFIDDCPPAPRRSKPIRRSTHRPDVPSRYTIMQDPRFGPVQTPTPRTRSWVQQRTVDFDDKASLDTSQVEDRRGRSGALGSIPGGLGGAALGGGGIIGLVVFLAITFWAVAAGSTSSPVSSRRNRTARWRTRARRAPTPTSAPSAGPWPT